MGALEFRFLVPAAHVHPGDVVPAEGMLALLAAAGDVVRIQGDEGVLFLLRVDPLHDPVPDEVGKPEAAHLEPAANRALRRRRWAGAAPRGWVEVSGLEGRPGPAEPRGGPAEGG